MTPIFLHGGVGHLVSNCIALYILGMACEHVLGWRQTAAVYLASGIVGCCVSVAMSPGPSVRASGAIFGVMSCVIVFLYRYQHLFYVRDKRIGFVLLAWACLTVGAGFMNPTIDNYAHIGGLINGAIDCLFTRPWLAPAAAPGFQVLPVNPVLQQPPGTGPEA